MNETVVATSNRLITSFLSSSSSPTNPNQQSISPLPTVKDTSEIFSSSSTTPTVDTTDEESVPILLLNGFGVGSFHQHRLIQELFNTQHSTNSPAFSREQRVYCIDYLGQGNSWPLDCQDGKSPVERNLRYCAQTWVDQIIAFIEQVIIPNENDNNNQKKKKSKVHIVGNSVGGHLAVFIAAQRPDLVSSLALLNATPLWGFNLPGWDGRLPAPWLPGIIGRYLFDRIRDLKTIEAFLAATYFNKAAYDETLIQNIRACTERPGGHAAFASILWSPPISVPSKEGNGNGNRQQQQQQQRFYHALSCLDCDVLLLFGKEDPWCKPAFARRMLEQLPNHHNHNDENKTTTVTMVAGRYIECSQVGHCPNHEAPVATARVLQNWWRFNRYQRIHAPLFHESPIYETWGPTTLRERYSHEIPLHPLDRLVLSFL